MKEILIQLSQIFVGIFCLLIQMVALVFVSISWMFDKIGTLLSGAAVTIANKIKLDRGEEETSEEVPV
jgi:hypothetical protein